MRLTKKEKELLRRGKAFAEDYRAYCQSKMCNDGCVFAQFEICVGFKEEVRVTDFLDFNLEAIE